MDNGYVISISVADDDVTHRGADDGMSPQKIVDQLSVLPTDDLLDVKTALDKLVQSKTTASAG